MNTKNATPNEYLVIHSGGEKRDETLRLIGPKTKKIHIVGHPLFSLFEAIMSQAQNLKTIQVTPTYNGRLVEKKHLKLCTRHGVKIIYGHVQPDLSWADTGIVRNPQYEKYRKFLIGLKGEQRRLWNELLRFKIQAAQITARYYCLKGEPYISQRRLCQEFGYRQSSLSLMVTKINAVLFYLDPNISVGKSSINHAKFIKLCVQRLRTKEQEKNKKQKFATDLGLPYYPAGLRKNREKRFARVIKAYRAGVMEKLKNQNIRSCQVLVIQYGLNHLDKPRYLTHAQVRAKMKGKNKISRARISQLELRGLEKMGIL